jgi:hypothetical protein
MNQGTPKRFQEYVVTDLPKYIEVAGHRQPAPFWILPEMFPDVHLRLAGMDVSEAVGAPHAAPHSHEIPEICFCASEHKGAVVIEMQMEDETFPVQSPFAIFIPAGVKHRFTVIKCDAPHFVFAIALMDAKDKG